MGRNSDTRQSFYRRLTKDVAANTLAISAAAIVPLMAMVGGGVDASRYYMAESRLQAACDAGALAARRSMDDDDFSKADQEIGDNFFNQNYPAGTFGIEDLEHNFTGTDDGEVLGTASGTMPTAIMGVFGFKEIEMSVTCSADINISNTDIMFVLDVTGSMAWKADGTQCGLSGGYWVECTDSRIGALRDSVVTFYDTVEAATSPSAQVRYGIVPYSAQVNVGNSLDAAWLASSHTYQSREADWETGYTGGTTSISYTRTGTATNWTNHGVETRTWFGITYDQCVTRANTVEQDIFHSSNQNNWTQVSQTGPNPLVTTYTGNVTYRYYATNWSYTQTYRASDGRCRLNQDYRRYDAASTITETTSGGVQTNNFVGWVYKPVTYNVSNVKANGYLVAPTGWDGANVTHAWNGCIEEASTVATATWNPIPATAFDLNIDLVPMTDSQKWKPMLTSLVFERQSGGSRTRNEVESTTSFANPIDYCPKPARRLAPFASRADVEAYLSRANGFIPHGATYHDIGMIWGARFINPDGLFEADNRTAPNGDAISRHIVFMTDGELAPSDSAYGLYGLEWWDRRVTTDGSFNQQFDRHASRFQAACRAARNKNISIWVVAFGTELTQNLIDCATPGRAYSADSSDELDDAFREIAEKIAALRLTE